MLMAPSTAQAPASCVDETSFYAIRVSNDSGRAQAHRSALCAPTFPPPSLQRTSQMSSARAAPMAPSSAPWLSAQALFLPITHNVGHWLGSHSCPAVNPLPPPSTAFNIDCVGCEER